jgi:diaminopimelate decarboxylase
MTAARRKPLDSALVSRLAEAHGTPYYLYDAAVFRERVAALRDFDVIRFAQKACSNTHILRLLRAEGCVVDAVSLGEIERALRAGFDTSGPHSGIVFTADIADETTLDRCIELDVPVNAGSPDMLAQLGQRHRGHRVWLRVNPGFGHGHSRKTNTGGEWSKHGIWHAHLDEAMCQVEKYDLDLVGLHMHIGSGADFDHLRQVCDAMVAQVRALDVDVKEVEGIVGHSVSLEIEPGRFLAGESGVLVARVRAKKRMADNRFILVDAGFDNLVRPAMYGSYHEISIVKPSGEVVGGATEPTVVAGPLCESGDVFTQEEGGVVVPRDLPDCEVGDLVVLHDAGAYASSMASNYNSRPLAPEILIDGEPRLIRRRQRVDELLALEEV